MSSKVETVQLVLNYWSTQVSNVKLERKVGDDARRRTKIMMKLQVTLSQQLYILIHYFIRQVLWKVEKNLEVLWTVGNNLEMLPTVQKSLQELQMEW